MIIKGIIIVTLLNSTVIDIPINDAKSLDECLRAAAVFLKIQIIKGSDIKGVAISCQSYEGERS